MKRKIYTFMAIVAFAMTSVCTMADDIVPATFEDLEFPEGSDYWRISDDAEVLYFQSGSFWFNSWTSSYPKWTYNAYSRTTDNTFDMALGDSYATNPGFFNSICGGGYKSSAFGVCSTQNCSVYFADGRTDVMSGLYITSGALIKYAVENGYDTAVPYTTGDYLKINFRGYDENNVLQGEVEFYLVDYRSEDESEHYIVDDWQWLDLSSIGPVKYMTTTSSAKQSKKGRSIVPPIFCLDNFGAKSPTAVAPIKDADSGENVRASAGDGAIFVSGAIGQDVRIYSVAGALVNSATLTDGGTRRFAVQAGTYVVQAGQKTSKVVVR